jgi:biopolymer transport protein ExbB/TolQ
MNKGVLLPIVFGVAIVGCLIAVTVNFGAMEQTLNRERYNRMDIEQKLEQQLKKSMLLSAQLGEANQQLEGIQKIVNKDQAAASQLKASAEVISKENEDLKAAMKKLQDELAARQKIAEDRSAAITSVAPPVVEK